MPFLMQAHWRRIVIVLVASILCTVSRAAPAADPISNWSRIALGDGDGAAAFSPHTVTLMHIAMHDALNAIDPRFARWSDARGETSEGDERAADEAAERERASPAAAVAAAAHAVLLAREPRRRVAFDAALDAALAAVPAGSPRDTGIALGRAAAKDTLAKYDGTRVEAGAYAKSDEPGRWRPTPPAPDDPEPFVPFEAFAGDALSAIGVPPPPEPGSAEYRFVVGKVRVIGARESQDRSADQAAAAWFWARQSPIRNFLALAVRTIEARAPYEDLWASARTMALASIALSDSFTLAARAKQQYRYWRPITAIREGGFGIDADPGWTPLVSTPQHPEYPSAHAAECAAGATMARYLFGSASTPLRFVATDADGRPSRTYESFGDIAAECAASREWAGVHFSASNAAGLALGEAVARRVADTRLGPMRATRARANEAGAN